MLGDMEQMFSCSEGNCGAVSAVDMEHHLCAVHLNWTPWQCPYCRDVNSASEPFMVRHLTRKHPQHNLLVRYFFIILLSLVCC